VGFVPNHQTFFFLPAQRAPLGAATQDKKQPRIRVPVGRRNAAATSQMVLRTQSRMGRAKWRPMGLGRLSRTLAKCPCRKAEPLFFFSWVPPPQTGFPPKLDLGHGISDGISPRTRFPEKSEKMALWKLRVHKPLKNKRDPGPASGKNRGRCPGSKSEGTAM